MGKNINKRSPETSKEHKFLLEIIRASTIHNKKLCNHPRDI
jgi:hypothetical protein